MPDKEGSDDEKKSTKSVVNKKQKQMMGEEGYDIARDEGRVKPSKDKKDATSYPVSDEVKKTQKKNKGPSALELVKKKYKGKIMNVGKKKANEELDLTQVAEAFGGYIIESEVDDEGNIIARKGESKKQKKLFKREVKRITSPKPGEIERAKKMMAGKTDPIQDKELGALSKTGAEVQKEIETETGRRTRKFTPASGTGLEPNVDDGTQSVGGKVTTYKIGDQPPEGKVAKAQRLKNRKPRTIPFKFKRTYSPEVQKKVDAVMKGIETRKIINPDKRSGKRVSASGTPFKIPSKPKSTPLFFTNRPKGVGDTGTGLRKSLKQFKIDADSFDKKLKTLKTDIKQTKTQIKQIPQPEVEKLKTKNVKLAGGGSKVTGDVETEQGPKVKTRSRNRVLQKVRVAARSTKRPMQRLVKPVGKLAARNPFAAAIVGTDLLDRVGRAIPKPSLPKMDVGVVGRRTAGQ